jgi:CRP/FNR family transcriptional regulator, cyclic AMP receptor protein
MSEEPSQDDQDLGLAAISLFKDLSPEALEKMSSLLENVTFKAGDTIFHAHGKGDALYVVHSGKVRIWVHDEDAKEVTLAELVPGDFFGEMSVLDGGERSANASVSADAMLHRLTREDFEEFLLSHPQAALEVIRGITARLRQTNLLVSQRVSRNVNEEMDDRLTFGQRIADKVAAFGGSWTFIFLFGGILVVWMAVNTFILAHMGKAPDGAQWDPYPYILLNLLLSTLAALQAPVIMMSQNRAAEKDRIAAELDYHVNLKSELMLEELIRKTRAQDAEIEYLVRSLNAVKEKLDHLA